MKTVLFLTIQFSISTQFSSIWPIDRTLSGATTPGHSGPGNDGKWRGTLHSPKLQHYWNLTIRLFNVISRTLVGQTGREGSYPSAENQSVYSTAPTNWTTLKLVFLYKQITCWCWLKLQKVWSQFPHWKKMTMSSQQPERNLLTVWIGPQC